MRALPLLLLLLALPVAAQDPGRAEAEQQLRELKAQIARYEQALTEARQEETDAAAVLEQLDREIAVREALIDSYRQRLASLSREAQDIEEQKAQLESELDQLRDEYATYARHAYMRGRLGDLALILSAGSINQMLVRTRYLQRFSERRHQKLRQIVQTQEALAERQAALDSAAVRTQTLLAESRTEQTQLASRKQERSQLVAELRQRSSGIQAQLQQRQNDANRLEARIQEFIAEEARRREAERREAERRREEERQREAARRAEAEAAGRPAPPPVAPVPDVAEEELVRLSGTFRQNRGNLPWPASGVITGTFGLRTHPVYGTQTRSIGIEIATSPTTPVKAVFDGAVSRIFVMPGYGTCVMVSHGDYATIYGNLSGVSVRQGQRVSAGQTVGSAGTADAPLGAGVFFALFANGQATDPVPWLLKR